MTALNNNPKTQGLTQADVSAEDLKKQGLQSRGHTQTTNLRPNIDDFIGLLANRTSKIATLEEINIFSKRDI